MLNNDVKDYMETRKSQKETKYLYTGMVPNGRAFKKN